MRRRDWIAVMALTAAAVSHHRIELMQAGDHALELIHIDVHVLSQLRDVI